MNDEVAELLRMLQTLPEDVRAEITHRLWESIPNVQEELFLEYEQELFEDIYSGIQKTRPTDSLHFAAEANALSDQALLMSFGDRVVLTHMLWQGLSCMDSIFGHDDPEFIAELNRRMADMDSGKTRGILHEDMMRQMKEKYG